MAVNLIMGYIIPFVILFVAGYLIRNFRDEKVVMWVDIAVEAAEQIYNGSGRGKEKFDYVAGWISDKFDISKTDLKNLIESAVYKLNERKRGVAKDE